MNIPQSPNNTIEWSNVEYEYLTNTCSGGSNENTELLNKTADKGWELIHIASDGAKAGVAYWWRKLKVLGVPIK